MEISAGNGPENRRCPAAKRRRHGSAGRVVHDAVFRHPALHRNNRPAKRIRGTWRCERPKMIRKYLRRTEKTPSQRGQPSIGGSAEDSDSERRRAPDRSRWYPPNARAQRAPGRRQKQEPEAGAHPKRAPVIRVTSCGFLRRRTVRDVLAGEV